MKRLVLILVVTTIGFRYVSFCQPIQAGLRAGVTMPGIKANTDESKDYGSRVAPFFGISLIKSITQSFNLQAEVNYSPQGAKRSGMRRFGSNLFGYPGDTFFYGDYETEAKLGYLELPLLVQFMTSEQKKGDHIFYFADFGPFIAMLFKAENVTSGSGYYYLDSQGLDPYNLEEHSFDHRTNIKEYLKPMNFGIVGSLGVGYNFKGQKIFLEVRFTEGVVNIQNYSEDLGEKETRSLIFSTGYLYSF